MKMERKFNTLTLEEYFYFIDNHKSYKDFNTLGLYRSIIENEKLNAEEKIKVRDYANKYFEKAFEFLQIKDPKTYIEISTIGQELTQGDRRNWQNIIERNQQRILKEKKIKHRNFGIYSKEYINDPHNGIMIKQGAYPMCFYDDKNKWSGEDKSKRNKSERKNEKQIIDKELNDE